MPYAPKVWYSSDWHINHKFMAKLRGFEKIDQDGVPFGDVEAHNDYLAAWWDENVDPRDTVFMLGDLGMSNFHNIVLPWFDERPGTKHLISGNHDDTFIGHSKWRKEYPKWAPHFASIQPSATVKLAGKKVLLSHFPYEEWGDGPGRTSQSRYNEFRLPDKGLPLLHGHTHGPEVAHGHSYHVGLDAHNLGLVSQDTILSWLETL